MIEEENLIINEQKGGRDLRGGREGGRSDSKYEINEWRDEGIMCKIEIDRADNQATTTKNTRMKTITYSSTHSHGSSSSSSSSSSNNSKEEKEEEDMNPF